MKDAGIDIRIFKLHSVQGATCSKAAAAGVIQLSKYWRQQIGPQKALSRSSIIEIWRGMTKKFGISVLASQGASNHTC